MSPEKKRLRIPNKIRLPFGYTVKVRLAPGKLFGVLGAPDCDGLWDCDTKTILIRKSLPVTRRRYILAHELGHAWLDWQHQHMDQGAAKN
jgi:hypothetical protein